jgi:RNA recognition motif-containing protein
MTIYVSSFDSDVTEAELRELFEIFGAVSRVTVHVPPGFAIVEMPDRAQAEEAINRLDGSLYGNKQLIVAECELSNSGGIALDG